jgi:hypothetical protein
MTVVGDDTTSTWPSAGTTACPSAYPAGGPEFVAPASLDGVEPEAAVPDDDVPDVAPPDVAPVDAVEPEAVEPEEVAPDAAPPDAVAPDAAPPVDDPPLVPLAAAPELAGVGLAFDPQPAASVPIATARTA